MQRLTASGRLPFIATYLSVQLYVRTNGRHKYVVRNLATRQRNVVLRKDKGIRNEIKSLQNYRR
jgi:hypothetical protein